jgi:hypothetical protein
MIAHYFRYDRVFQTAPCATIAVTTAGAGVSSGSSEHSTVAAAAAVAAAAEAGMWQQALAAAHSRGEDECPICVSHLSLHCCSSSAAATTCSSSNGSSQKNAATAVSSTSKQKEHSCASKQEVSLTSCSHAFHSRCLAAFEAFNIYEVPLCPVCRAGYRSVPLQSIHTCSTPAGKSTSTAAPSSAVCE